MLVLGHLQERMDYLYDETYLYGKTVEGAATKEDFEKLERKSFDKTIMEMHMAVKNIDSLLRKRTELKKR